MPWTYYQESGRLYDPNGTLAATGYSGAGTTTLQGRNNSAMEDIPNVGPIPQGDWAIGTMMNSAQTGPNVLPLTPVGHNAHGRNAFQIHGNNATNDASHGCVIMPPAVRQAIANSGDTVLHVLPGTGPAATPTPTPTSTPTPTPTPTPSGVLHVS